MKDLEIIEEELTRLLIKQDFEDKKNKNVKMIRMSQVDLLRLEIKFIKFMKRYLLHKDNGV